MQTKLLIGTLAGFHSFRAEAYRVGRMDNTCQFNIGGSKACLGRAQASRPEVNNKKRPNKKRFKDDYPMDVNTNTIAQAKEIYGKMSTATTEAADLIKNSYSTAVKGVFDYNNKFIEFTQANTNAAYDFVQKLTSVQSPSAFAELSTEHVRKQLETVTEQTRQLAALAQKVTLATAEPIKTGIAKAFNPAL